MMPTKEELDKQIEEIRRQLAELKRQKAEYTQVKIKGDIKEVDVKKAVIVETPEGNQRGIISLWEDGKATACVGNAEGYGECYTTDKEGEKIYYIMQAWAAWLGYKIKPVHEEKERNNFE